VGTRRATELLHDGDLVTVDARRGEVRAGGLVLDAASPALPAAATSTPSRPAVASLATRPALATKVYVNLAMADQAEAVAALPVDGVGLLRAEFMILDALENMHPRAFVAAHGGEKFVDRMASRLLRHCARLCAASRDLPLVGLSYQRVSRLARR
jgi:pyruvate,water dikinase